MTSKTSESFSLAAPSTDSLLLSDSKEDACVRLFVKTGSADKQYLHCTLPNAPTSSSALFAEEVSPIVVQHAQTSDTFDRQLCQYLTAMISKLSDGKLEHESRELLDDITSALYHRGIEVGDLVSLTTYPTLTLQKTATIDDAILLEKCLGDKSWGRVGVVVAKKHPTMSTVKELLSGQSADYVDEDLTFADGSPLGLVEKLPAVKVSASFSSCFFCEGPTTTYSSSPTRLINVPPCAMCNRPYGDPFCGVALYQCQSPSCRRVGCAACLFMLQREQVLIDPSTVTVPSGESTKHCLCDMDTKTAWKPATGYDNKWIEITLPSNMETFQLQIHTKAIRKGSPVWISVRCDTNGKGFSPVRVLDMSMFWKPQEWWTLLTSSDILSSPAHLH